MQGVGMGARCDCPRRRKGSAPLHGKRRHTVPVCVRREGDATCKEEGTLRLSKRGGMLCWSKGGGGTLSARGMMGGRLWHEGTLY